MNFFCNAHNIVGWAGRRTGRGEAAGSMKTTFPIQPCHSPLQSVELWAEFIQLSLSLTRRGTYESHFSLFCLPHQEKSCRRLRFSFSSRFSCLFPTFDRQTNMSLFANLCLEPFAPSILQQACRKTWKPRSFSFARRSFVSENESFSFSYHNKFSAKKMKKMERKADVRV